MGVAYALLETLVAGNSFDIPIAVDDREDKAIAEDEERGINIEPPEKLSAKRRLASSPSSSLNGDQASLEIDGYEATNAGSGDSPTGPSGSSVSLICLPLL